jgi:hypothetical protein
MIHEFHQKQLFKLLKKLLFIVIKRTLKEMIHVFLVKKLKKTLFIVVFTFTMLQSRGH